MNRVLVLFETSGAVSVPFREAGYDVTTIDILPHKINNSGMLLCKCDCGDVKELSCNVLTCGKTKSCGCLQKDIAKKNKTKHNGKYTRLYNTWLNIKRRCYNPSSKAFPYYGAKGIKMYDKWIHDFSAFKDWAYKNGYNDTLTIDRINNDGDYEPNNCRWATLKQQANNKKNVLKYKYNNKYFTISELSDKFNISHSVLYYRLKIAKWNIERALSITSKSES